MHGRDVARTCTTAHSREYPPAHATRVDRVAGTPYFTVGQGDAADVVGQLPDAVPQRACAEGYDEERYALAHTELMLCR